MNRFPEPNSVLVMDNAQIHHNGRIASIVEARGALIQYLPAYSPDLNPIEKGFSVYKATLRRYEDLLTGGDDDYEVIDGFVPLVFTGDMTRELFRGSGYSVF
jgi:transposase